MRIGPARRHRWSLSCPVAHTELDIRCLRKIGLRDAVSSRARRCVTLSIGRLVMTPQSEASLVVVWWFICDHNKTSPRPHASSASSRSASSLSAIASSSAHAVPLGARSGNGRNRPRSRPPRHPDLRFCSKRVLQTGQTRSVATCAKFADLRKRVFEQIRARPRACTRCSRISASHVETSRACPVRPPGRRTWRTVPLDGCSYKAERCCLFGAECVRRLSGLVHVSASRSSSGC